MSKCVEIGLIVATVVLSVGLCGCHRVDESKALIRAKPVQGTTLHETFRYYMAACVEKNINAMTDVYDLDHIAVKWGEKAGNNQREIREMIKGIVANKPDEFYQTCARVLKEPDKVIEKEMPESDGKAPIVEVTFEDWSWTFRQGSSGWKLIEEGVSGQTFDRVSREQGVLCISPQGQFDPQSESELFAELNSQLPFEIPRNNFISKQKAGGIVGWAIVRNDQQKDVTKKKLEDSPRLKLLQVESMSPELEELFRQARAVR